MTIPAPRPDTADRTQETTMTETLTAPAPAPAKPGAEEVTVWSFGYLHGPPPPADLTVDVRAALSDPSVDPALRGHTGHNLAVAARVLATPGAADLPLRVAAVAAALADLCAARSGVGRVTVAVGCGGGRHRSVVVAERVAGVLRAGGRTAQARHRDAHRPVVEDSGHAATGRAAS